MKHAGDKALDALEPILLRLRGVEGLRERKRGAFYRKSTAFVHFHDGPAARARQVGGRRIGDLLRALAEAHLSFAPAQLCASAHAIGLAFDTKRF